MNENSLQIAENNYLLGSRKVTFYTIRGVGYSLFVPVVAWLIKYLSGTYEFSILDFWKMHRESPLLFLIDLFPVIIGVAVYLIIRRVEEIKSDLEDQINEKNEIIEKNAKFAHLIGQKEFTIDLDYVAENDTLGKSLLLMRKNLLVSNQKENELNWIARGKDLISNVLRQNNTIEGLAFQTLVNLIKYINAIQGIFYIYDNETQRLTSIASYAYNRKKFLYQEVKIGQGLIGEAAYEMDIIYRTEIPDDYFTITSGMLGDKKPQSLLIVPLISDEKLQGVIEFGSLNNEIPELTLKFVKELSAIIGQTIFNLKVNARTEKLLHDAQRMTQELRLNEEELRKNAIEMRKTQEELEETNQKLETQIEEVENAQQRLYSLLENASEVITIYDVNGLIKYESPSVKHILGYSPEGNIGRKAFDSDYTIANDKLKKVYQELLKNNSESRTFEFSYEKNDGETIWLEATGRNLLNNPAIGGIIFNIRDITVRKIAEKARRISGQMQALSENSVDMIMRFGTNGNFFYVNPMVEKVTGVIINDLLNKHLSEVRLESSLSQFFLTTINQVIDNDQKIEVEINFPTVEGIKIMLINAIPEYNEDKELESILVVAHDITEQKRIEQEIREKNKNISDSINYAQRIQSAILPDNRMIREFLPDSFVFYKPKDVVSGDFPWFFKKDDDIYIAAVDCTGHGVPGALLSFIGYFLLNSIVDHESGLPANEVLNRLHESVRTTLKQDRVDADARDGMDIALCKINKKKKEVQYAGAHRPLYFQKQDGEFFQYRGDAKAVGGIPDKKKEETGFTNSEVKFDPGDKLFFFSDGITDQVGGPKGRKYQASRIRDIIIENKSFNMLDFAKYFHSDFYEWKGENKQIDDVLLIGIQL
jgi:PAS domain S-box-containing protein